jgi:hypothetical protein
MIYNKSEDYRMLNIIERLTMTEHFWLTLSSTQVINVRLSKVWNMITLFILGDIRVFAKESADSVLWYSGSFYGLHNSATPSDVSTSDFPSWEPKSAEYKVSFQIPP